MQNSCMHAHIYTHTKPAVVSTLGGPGKMSMRGIGLKIRGGEGASGHQWGRYVSWEPMLALQ